LPFPLLSQGQCWQKRDFPLPGSFSGSQLPWSGPVQELWDLTGLLTGISMPPTPGQLDGRFPQARCEWPMPPFLPPPLFRYWFFLHTTLTHYASGCLPWQSWFWYFTLIPSASPGWRISSWAFLSPRRLLGPGLLSGERLIKKSSP
jgi:hypothetical protein